MTKYPFTLKDAVKDNRVEFTRYFDSSLYYSFWFEDEQYEFPVPISDIGTATFLAEDKAMLFMRYIRKAMEVGTILKLTNIAISIGNVKGVLRIDFQ